MREMVRKVLDLAQVRKGRPGWRRRCLLVLAAAVALAACTGPAPDAAQGNGGTLNVAIAEEAGVLDPHVFTGNFLLLDMIYEPLVDYGEDGALEPGLASSWKVSGDGRQVVFELQQGVRFHDGTPFDAQAVKWNFDRWVGKEDYGFFRTSKVIQKVEATDPDTVTLTLSEPYEPLIQELSIVRPVRFLSPASVAADAAFSRPVGTGPWRLESSSSSEAVLVRHDGYWGDAPTLDRVRFTVIPDSQTRVSALRSGEVDLIGGSYLAPITPLEATGLQRTDGVRMLTGDPDTTFLLSFSTRGPAADRAVREAIGLAIDREALKKVLYSGLGDPAATLFPPGVPDAGPPMDVRFDPVRARAVLDAGGWAQADGRRARNGTPLALELVVPSEPVHGVQDSRSSAEAVAGALGEIGITVTIRSVDSAAYLDERSAGNYDLSFVETLGAPYDPSSTVVSYLTSTADAGGVVWTTPELDRLVDAALFARDPGARAQVLALLRRLRDELGMAMIVISHDLAVVAELADTVAVMYAGRVVEYGAPADLLRDPDHPYSRGLLDAVPRLGVAPGTRFSTMPGVASRGPAHLAGCAFAPRCPHALPRCGTDVPPLEPIDSPGSHGGRRSACWVHPGVPVREGV